MKNVIQPSGKYIKTQHSNHRTKTDHLFKVLRKCNSKFDCLVYKMLYIKDIKPSELKKWSSQLLGNLSDYLICALAKFQVRRRDSTQWPVRCRCSDLTKYAVKPLRCDLVNLLGACVPLIVMKEWKRCPVCEVKFFRCTYETVAKIVQQVWRSFLQFIP